MCVCDSVCVCVRERESVCVCMREREGERETARQTDRRTECACVYVCAYFHIHRYVRVSGCVAWKVQGVVGWGGGGNAMAVMDIDFVLLLIVKIIGVLCLG